VVCGVLVISWMSLSAFLPEDLASYASNFHANLTIVLGTMTILLVGFLVTLFIPRPTTGDGHNLTIKQ